LATAVFFPGHLAQTGREEMLQAMKQAGVEAVVLPADQSNHGAIESYDEAKRCAAHFRAHGDAIDGVIVTLPNLAMSAPSRTPCDWRG